MSVDFYLDSELVNKVRKEPWLFDLVKKGYLSWSDIEKIVDDFVLKYYSIPRQEVSTRFIWQIIECVKLCVTTPSN